MAKATSQAAEYRALDDKGLADKISDNEMQMKRMQFSHAVTPLENPVSMRILRRETARLKTEQRKRTLGI